MADRQAVDFTLLLTAVAFKLVVVGMLPPVSYFTYIDYYVLFCLVFLAAIAVRAPPPPNPNPSLSPNPHHPPHPEVPAGVAPAWRWCSVGCNAAVTPSRSPCRPSVAWPRDGILRPCLLLPALVPRPRQALHSVLPWISTGLSEVEARDFDLQTFYYAAAVWAAFNLLSGLIASRLAVTTAAPFNYGRVVADMDREQLQASSPSSPDGKMAGRMSAGGGAGAEDVTLAACSA